MNQCFRRADEPRVHDCRLFIDAITNNRSISISYRYNDISRP